MRCVPAVPPFPFLALSPHRLFPAFLSRGLVGPLSRLLLPPQDVSISVLLREMPWGHRVF